MMTLIKIAVAAALGATAIAAFSETPQETVTKAIKKTIEPRLGDGAKVESVTKTPYSGLYEIRAGGDIFYTDEKARYLFVGRVLDTATFKDYTKDRIDEINKIKFSDLPLDSALKMVKGNGKRVIAVFEDPNCGYCKRFRQTLNEMENVTVYTFMYNILSSDSETKSRDIWCTGAADRAKAWDDWMLNGKAAPTAPASCSTPNERILALGKKLRVTGTPTVFFTDGSRFPGAVEGKAIEEKLASIK